MIKKLILITLLGISFLAGSVLAAPLPAISNANCVFYFNFDQVSGTYGSGLYYGGSTTAQTGPLDNKCGTQDGNVMVPWRMIPLHTSGGVTISSPVNWRDPSASTHTTNNNIKANGGVFDKGIYFDTSQSIMANFAVINNTFLGENDEMSMAFWLRVDETLAGPLFEIWDAGIYERRTRIQAEIDSSTGRLEINSFAGLEAYSSNNLITDEDLHFVVITFDDTNNDWYIYLDGQDVTDVNTYNQGSAALEIDNWDLSANRLGLNLNRDYRDVSGTGAGYNTHSDKPQYLDYSWVTYTDGPIIQLDEISMYNVRLTQTEINQMYNDGVGRRWLELYGGTDDAIDLEDGLKLYYDMDSVSNTVQDDKTGNNYDLGLDNSPIQTTGKINYARDFDGSTQYGRPVNITRNSGLIAGNFETSLAPSGSTISTAWAFWAYPNTPSSTDSLLGWYRPPRSNNNAIGVEAYQCRSGEWNLFYRWEYGTGIHGDGGPSCDANVFQHIVWVWDKENFKIYKNGILARSYHEDNTPYAGGSSYPYTSCLTGSTDAAKEIEIGLGTNLNCQYPNQASSSYDFFDGVIDEVAFYYNDTDILNHHEVKCLYNSGLGYTYLAITGNPTCTGSTSGSGSGTNVTDGIVTNTGNIYYWNVGYPNQVTGDITYNSVTKMINYTWYDGGAATDYGRLEVYIWNGTTKQLIHETNGGTDSGTLLFNYTDYTDYSFIAHGFISDVTRTYVTNGLIWVDTLTRGSTPLNPDDFGNDGLFWSAILIGTLMLFGIWNPPVALGLGLFGLYLTSTLGIISLGSTALWSIVLIAIIIMWRIKA